MIRLPLAVAAAVLVAASAVGCSAVAVENSVGQTAPPSMERYIEQIKADGADDAQLAVFADGEVTFEEYEGAMGRFFSCVEEDTDAWVSDQGVVTKDGARQISYTLAAPDEAKLAVAQECYQKHVGGVDAFWQLYNPDSIAYRERRAEALAPALSACLDEAGHDFGRAAYQDMVDFTMKREIDGLSGGDCLATIGHETWDG